jgi:tetratricopeptide (TPR) repeat protein
MNTHRDLLPAVLAYRAGLIDADRLAEAVLRWNTKRQDPLVGLLIQRGWLTPEDKPHLEYLAERSLQAHRGDATAALAGLTDATLRRSLAEVSPDLLPTSLEVPPEAYLDPDAHWMGRRIEKRWQWLRILGVIAASLLGIALVGGVGMLFLTRTVLVQEQARAEEARARAEMAQVEEMRQRQQAEVNFQQARHAVDELLAQAAEKEAAQDPQTEAVRQKLLEEALQFYQAVLQEKGGDPLTRSKAAQVYLRLAEQYLKKEDLAKAEEANRQAVALLEKLATDDPNVPEYQRDLAGSYALQGKLLQTARRAAEAEQAYRRALALAEKLVRGYPAVPDYRLLLARGANDLGTLQHGNGKVPEAEATYRRAIALLEKLTTDFPNVPAYRQALAECQSNLAKLQEGTK